MKQDDLPKQENGYPLSFESFVKPIGFQLPLDENGDLLKASINMEVCEDIVPK